MSDVIAPKRRRLSELYVTGRLVELTGPVDDGTSEETVPVWVSKISPLEQKEAADRASSARASILAIKHLPDEDEKKLPYWDQLEDLISGDRDALVSFLTAQKVQEAELSAEARLGSEGKWAENDYLSSLQEAWNSKLRDKYLKDPADEEALRVFNELKSFADEVRDATTDDRAAYMAAYDGVSDQELKKKALDQIIQAESDFAWMTEFRKWQIFFSVRDPEDHKERYFLDREEIDTLDTHVYTKILNTFNDLNVEALEGKG